MDEFKDYVMPTVLAAIGAAWAGIRFMFGIAARVKALETSRDEDKKTFDREVAEIKLEIKSVADRAEKRHDAFDVKLDMLIDKLIP